MTNGSSTNDGNATRERAEPTPIVVTSRTRWILVAAVLFLLYWVGHSAPTARAMLLGGITLALFLSFPVTQLARIMPRGLAVLVTFLGLVLVGVIAVVVLVPIIVEQLTSLAEATPDLARNVENVFRDVLERLERRGLLEGTAEETLASVRSGISERLQGIVEMVLASLLDLLSNTVGLLFQAVGILFVASTLVSSADRIRETLVNAVPEKYRGDADELVTDMGESTSRFMGGLAISALEQGALATVALYFIGVPYALLLGILTAVTSILPYIGAWFGAAPAIVIAATVSPVAAILTLLAYVAINMFDGNVVSPRLQGRALRVSPIITFLAVIAGGQIAGPFGSVLALPLVGALRVLYDFLDARVRVVETPPAMRTVVLTTRPDGSSGGRGGARVIAARAPRRRRRL